MDHLVEEMKAVAARTATTTLPSGESRLPVSLNC